MRLSMSENRDQMGIVWSVFQMKNTLSREEFVEKFEDENCSWILDENSIRIRMMKSFSSIEILDEIDRNTGN